ncbi:MAG: mechanosensitive ion channel family protein [Treponema sp.]|nr:mechanosensitive ion channel family protein [Treponema sp.]
MEECMFYYFLDTTAETSAEGNAVIGTVHDAGIAAVKKIASFKDIITKWCKDNLISAVGTVLLIFALYIIYKLCIRAIKKVPPEKLSPQKAVGVLKIVQYAYYFIVVMYILSLFGVKLSAIWGAAGVAGVALAFAAQTSVSNIISGIFIVAEKTMKPGDLITVGSETGVVDTIGLLSVQIHTLDNQLIRIPNSTIINSNMLNTSFFPRRRICITVYVSYDTDMEYALETLKKVPALCKTVLKDPAPAAWFDGFGDSGIKLVLAVWFNSADFLATKNAAYIGIKKVFDEAKIEIPYTKIDVNFPEETAGFKSASAKKALVAKKSGASKKVKK